MLSTGRCYHRLLRQSEKCFKEKKNVRPWDSDDEKTGTLWKLLTSRYNWMEEMIAHLWKNMLTARNKDALKRKFIIRATRYALTCHDCQTVGISKEKQAYSSRLNKEKNARKTLKGLSSWKRKEKNLSQGIYRNILIGRPTH